MSAKPKRALSKKQMWAANIKDAAKFALVENIDPTFLKPFWCNAAKYVRILDQLGRPAPAEDVAAIAKCLKVSVYETFEVLYLGGFPISKTPSAKFRPATWAIDREQIEFLTLAKPRRLAVKSYLEKPLDLPGRTRRVFTKEEGDKILSMIAEGFPVKQIQSELKTGRPQILIWLTENGHDIPRKSDPNEHKRVVLSDDQIEILLEMADKDTPIAQISRRIGISDPTTKKYLQQHGYDYWKKQKYNEGYKPKSVITISDEMELKRLEVMERRGLRRIGF